LWAKSLGFPLGTSPREELSNCRRVRRGR
jgi:hypothetical protein